MQIKTSMLFYLQKSFQGSSYKILLMIMCFTGLRFIIDQRVSRVDNAADFQVGI